MSIYIPESIVKLSSSILVQVDMSKLGPRQKSAFKRMVKTGLLDSGGMPEVMARKLLQKRGVPYVTLDKGRFATVGWHDIPLDEDHPVRSKLIAASVAASMLMDQKRAEISNGHMDYYTKRVHEGVKTAQTEEKGSAYLGSGCTAAMKQIKKINMGYEFDDKLLSAYITFDYAKGETFWQALLR